MREASYYKKMSLRKQGMGVEGEREKWCGFRVGLWSMSHQS